MKQFGTILSFELRQQLKNKVFIGATLLFVLMIAAVMFFPRISGLFRGQKSASSSDSLPVMLVRPLEAEGSDAVRESFAEAFPGYEVEISADESTKDIEGRILSGEVKCAIVITGEDSYTYYVNDLSLYDANMTVADELMQKLYQENAMIASGVDPQRAEQILSAQIHSHVQRLGVDQMQNYFYTYIMIFALYMVILLYGQMVATNVATEKSSRAMELLITSAKPVSMMFGKVIASCLTGFFQLTAVFGSAFLCYNLNRELWSGNKVVDSIFDMPLPLLGYLLIFFVLGFFIYAFLYGAVGSTASRLEDINTSVMPITLIFIIAFMAVMFSLGSGNVDTTVMKVCSFIPFTSPMAMFTRIAMSQVPWPEILISIVILMGSVVGIGIISAKIYRVGVLLYGTTPKWGTLLKTVWKA